MKAIAFKFTLPGKKPDEEKSPRQEPDEGAEDEGGDDEKVSTEDLGKAVVRAIRTGDGEAVYEAIRRLVDASPADE